MGHFRSAVFVLTCLFASLGSIVLAQEPPSANAVAAYERGLSLCAEGSYTAAEEAFSQAIRLAPEFVEAYDKRAFCREQLHQLEAALQDYDVVVKARPESAPAWLKRGAAQLAAKNIEAAISDLSACLERSEPSPGWAGRPGAFSLRGLARHEAGLDEEAIADFDEAIRLDPGNDRGYGRRGVCRQSLRQWEGALADFNAALRVDPQDTEWRLGRARVRAWLGDPDGARADYDAMLNVEPLDADAWIARAIFRGLRNESTGALSDLEQAIRLAPDDPAPLSALAHLYACWGDDRLALEAVGSALKHSGPGEGQYTVLLGMACRLRLGEQPIFTPELRAPFQNSETKGVKSWPALLAACLNGEIGDGELLRHADVPNLRDRQERMCEAWYTISVVHLARGEVDFASECLDRCLNTECPLFWEWGHALSERIRLARPIGLRR